MKNKFSIIITFFILISLPINNLFAQQFHKILDFPGGSGTTNNSSSSDNSKTTLYVVGGVIIAGIVIYSLLKDKKEESKEDTTAVILDKHFLEQNLTINEKISNMQSRIPINISIGLQSNGVIREEKRYFLGLDYNF
jgi:hypothetical protein